MQNYSIDWNLPDWLQNNAESTGNRATRVIIGAKLISIILQKRGLMWNILIRRPIDFYTQGSIQRLARNCKFKVSKR